MNLKITPKETTVLFPLMLSETNSYASLNPRKKTLSFIKQVAYSYHSENKMPSNLAGIMLN